MPRRSTRCTALAVAAALAVPALALTTPAGALGATATATADVPDGKVIVRGTAGAADDVARAVEEVGGTVTAVLPIVDGVAAELPEGAGAELVGSGDAVAVTPDTEGTVHAVGTEPAPSPTPSPSAQAAPKPAADAESTGQVVAAADTGNLAQMAKIVGADYLWQRGFTGRGVDVAVIDTGVAPVKGLNAPGKVVNGPDLSFDSQTPELRYKDAYGHGTHMASIIAGRDTLSTGPGYVAGKGGFTGIAPDARIVNVKVGAADGSADVSQVIAAINWVTENRTKNGLNIRVLNLSYGTDSAQDYTADPLTYAVEAAWRKGIVVVVSAGNDGTTNKELASPAADPNIIAVGASDPVGTIPTNDDTLPAFSNRGTTKRFVDLVAPGVRVLGLRVPNGVIDQRFPASKANTRFTRGSGTSQSAAVVSGATALLLSAYPSMTPDQIKAALRYTAFVPPAGTPERMGAGVLSVSWASSIVGQVLKLAPPAPKWGKGTGTLEKARGSARVYDGDVPLTGEVDIFGKAWNGKTWAPKALAGTTWTGGSWNGSDWTGTAFGAGTTDWEGRTWVGNSWAGVGWNGRTWVGRTWVGDSWDGRTWVGATWNGRTWIASSWSSSGWN